MSELLGVTVEDLVRTAKQRGARIPSEIGAFVALEVCEALIRGPAAVRTSDVRIADDGTVGVFAPPGSATSEEAARSVLALLGALLVAAGTGVPRGLVALIENGPSSGRLDLSSLRDDLEASLVPLNRAAARRVLSRMLRDVRRPRLEEAAAPEPAAAPEETLDAQLDALLEGQGIAPAPPPAPSAAELDAELDATISELDAPSAAEVAARAAGRALAAEPLGGAPVDPDDATLHEPLEPPSMAPRSAPPEPVRGKAEAHPPAARGRPAPDDLEALGAELEARRKKGGALGWILAFAAVVTATAAALALMRPDLVDAMLGRPPPPAPDPGPTPEEIARMQRERRARFGTLTIEVEPPRAQVLMYVGRGPAIASELPIGVAHEFVAIADGRRPTRAVVPSDAQWEAADGGARYELAMQAGSEPMEVLELGPTTLPRHVGTPTGALGSVRVITNPPGAKVYVLVGFSPTVTVENVRTDEAIELLVYLEGHAVERLVVGPSDWQPTEDGVKRATVRATLTPVSPARR